jgi:hypothetical protein
VAADPGRMHVQDVSERDHNRQAHSRPCGIYTGQEIVRISDSAGVLLPAAFSAASNEFLDFWQFFPNRSLFFVGLA